MKQALIAFYACDVTELIINRICVEFVAQQNDFVRKNHTTYRLNLKMDNPIIRIVYSQSYFKMLGYTFINLKNHWAHKLFSSQL